LIIFIEAMHRWFTANQKNDNLEVTANFPEHWSPGEKLLVPLNVNSTEFVDASKKFHRSCPPSEFSITAILRVQNIPLYKEYQLYRANLLTEIGPTHINEEHLFHGTSSSSVTGISKNGFDWRRSGVNGTLYGDGSYFAVDAHYSESYCGQDFQSHRHMFLARVLVGKSTKGHSKLRAAPEGFHSAVDNPANPEIYVVFHIKQAYPEYLIIFSRQNVPASVGIFINTTARNPAQKVPHTSSTFSFGEIVMSTWKGGSRWYPAKVAGYFAGHYAIAYDDGSYDDAVQPCFVRAVSSVDACSPAASVELNTTSSNIGSMAYSVLASLTHAVVSPLKVNEWKTYTEIKDTVETVNYTTSATIDKVRGTMKTINDTKCAAVDKVNDVLQTVNDAPKNISSAAQKEKNKLAGVAAVAVGGVALAATGLGLVALPVGLSAAWYVRSNLKSEEFKNGDTVEACRFSGTRWYPGKIKKFENNLYEIQFDDGLIDNLEAHCIQRVQNMK